MTTPPSRGQLRGEWPLPLFSHMASLTGKHVSSAPHIREDWPHASSFPSTPTPSPLPSCLSEFLLTLQVYHINSSSLPNGALVCLPALSSQTLESPLLSHSLPHDLGPNLNRCLGNLLMWSEETIGADA